MSDTFLSVLFLLVGIAAGFGLGWLTARARSQSAATAAGTADPRVLAEQLSTAQHTLEQTTAERDTAQRGLAAAQASLAAQNQQVVYLRDQLAQTRQAEQERVRAQHEAENRRQAELAEQREHDQAAIAEQNKRHQEELLRREQATAQENEHVIKLLAPVADQLTRLQQRVTTMEEGRKKESGQMGEQLRALSQSGHDLSEQTRMLAGVLTNNQARGHWGEISLRNLVEAAGMREHVDFDTQVVIPTGVDSSSRPDMVIYLPGGKQIPVDSKTPFQAYETAVHTDDSTPEGRDRRAKLLDDNVKAIKKHIDDLGRRDYSGILSDTPEFTIAFLPTEAVLSAALQTDPDLLSYAFAHKVALCSPVSLWAVLQATAASWQQQSLSDDAKELFRLCQQLYAGFRTLGGYVGSMGGQLERTVDTYNKLVGNLERTILPKARRLDEMDPKKITVLKEIGPDKAQVRRLTSSELTDEAEVSVTPVERPAARVAATDRAEKTEQTETDRTESATEQTASATDTAQGTDLTQGTDPTPDSAEEDA